MSDAWFAVRPSGAEPKLKIYIGASAETDYKCCGIIDTVRSYINKIVS